MGRLANPATAIFDGRKVVTTAGTPVQLDTTGVRVRSLVITAETDNTGLIAVGTSTVDATEGQQRGAIIEAGGSIGVDIDSLAKVYIDSTVNGDGVSFAYTT